MWRRASAPLIVAVGFALAFVALRLIYRVVFGGWPDSAEAWGDVSLAVLRRSLPFMAVIVAFGAVNTIVDVRSALIRWGGRGPLRNTRTAVVIALSSYPALLSSVVRVRAARRMRGDRSLGSLVVPVLERSLERGVTLGAAMEQRGFGAPTPSYGMCDAPVIARNLRLGFAATNRPSWSLDVGNLVVAHGSCVLLTGSTGSGKTALLRALTGRLQHSDGGWQEGVLEVGGFDRRGALPNETATFVSLVEQNTRDGFVASAVFDEIAFGLRMYGRSETDIETAVGEIAQRLGITDLLSRQTEEISAGEASLVALAAGLISQPSLLLLDEPIADLDEESAARVTSILTELHATTGITMIIAEHRWAALADLADVRLDLNVEGSIRHSTPVSVVPSSGSRITPLVAPNGAGKTTWLTAFATAHRANVRLVPEDPAMLFSRESVAAECAHNDRLVRVSPGTTLELVQRLVYDMPTDAHPRDLSTGQRLALACALQVAVRPDLLLLDEPTRGLDVHARAQLTEMLQEVASTGTAVIFATHDRGFAAQFSPTVVSAR
jgi:energy-coupling factor transport system ATP-binding protein